MPTPEPSTFIAGRGASRYAACYERLRERIRGRRETAATEAPVRDLSLATLLDEGLAAWLHAITPALCAAPAPIVSAAPAVAFPMPDGLGLASEIVPAAHHHDLAMVLANLVLSTRCTAHPSSGRPDHGDPRC